MLALSVLLLFLHSRTCKDDYRTSHPTVHCKIFTDFVNRPCSWRTRTTGRATQFVLRDWGHFSIVQYGRLICKILFTNISVIISYHHIYMYTCTVYIHIQYESGLCGVDSWIMWSWFLQLQGRRKSVCRTSIFVVKALKDFVEQMSDHDDLLQSVCWSVPCVAFATDG